MTTIPGRPRSSRRRFTAGVMTPRSSAMTGSSPELTADRQQHVPAGCRAPAARARRAPPRGHRPVGDEPAEVVDPRQVDQLQRAPEPLDPPAEPGRAVRVPVVERVAPQLAVPRVRVRRDARDAVGLEELRVERVVGAVGRHVDRHVADQPHAALGRVGAQRAPLALEAHLLRDRVAARERRPVADPERVARDERLELVRRHLRARLGEQPAPGRERRRADVRRAELVRRRERQDLPPRLPRRRQPVHEPVRLGPEPAAGQRGRVQQDPGGAR